MFRLLLFSLLLSLAGAAPRPLSGTEGVPLGVRSAILSVEDGVVEFYTDSPSYLALFALTPGGGTELLYPRWTRLGEQGRTFAGHHRVNDPGPDLRWRGARRLREDRRSYFLIASDRPLRLASLGRSPSALERALGSAFWAHDPQDTMEELIALLVRDSRWSSDWTADVYHAWWDYGSHRSYAYPYGERYRYRTVRVVCNGFVLDVPPERVQEVEYRLCGRSYYHPRYPGRGWEVEPRGRVSRPHTPPENLPSIPRKPRPESEPEERIARPRPRPEQESPAPRAVPRKEVERPQRNDPPAERPTLKRRPAGESTEGEPRGRRAIPRKRPSGGEQ